jgi:hypothetical protein
MNNIGVDCLMSLKTHGRTVAVLFIVGALARSLAIGLGQAKIGDLIGLVSMFALMSLGVRSLLLQAKKDTVSTIWQRIGGLLRTVISLVFCLSLLMHLFS